MLQDRIIVVGDIHGCLNSLRRLITKIQPTERDILVFTGDYVDRGPSIPETIEYLIELKEQFPNTIFIKGNHEDMFIKYLSVHANMDDWRMFMYNGGQQTVEQYKRFLNLVSDDVHGTTKYKDNLLWEDLPEKHKYFLQNLPVIHIDEENQYVAVHAGLRPSVDLVSQEDYDCVWIRDTFLKNPCTWGDFKVVHGHTPMTPNEAAKYHEKNPTRYNVDNGCVFGYNLTGVDILTGDIYSVLSEIRKDREMY